MNASAFETLIPGSLTKSELAEKYSVSVRTLMRWLKKMPEPIDLTVRIFRKIQLLTIVDFLGPW